MEGKKIFMGPGQSISQLPLGHGQHSFSQAQNIWGSHKDKGIAALSRNCSNKAIWTEVQAKHSFSLIQSLTQSLLKQIILGNLFTERMSQQSDVQSKDQKSECRITAGISVYKRKVLWSNEIIRKVVEWLPEDVAMTHDVLGEWKFIR